MNTRSTRSTGPGHRGRLLLLALASICALQLAGIGEARAQLLYNASLTVRGQYNSNVFASQQLGLGQDFVTELEPSLELSLGLRRSELALRYDFRFQLYALTKDPASGDNLLGYANELQLAYNHNFTPRSSLSLRNTFIQGTENTLVRSQVLSSGEFQPGLPTFGANFVSNTLVTQWPQEVSSRWTVQPELRGRFYHGYGEPDGEVQVRPLPDTYEAGAGVRATRRFVRHELFFGAELAWVGSKQQDPALDLPLLHQLVGTAGGGWRWQMHSMWLLDLAAGVSTRLSQLAEVQQTDEGDALNATSDWAPGVAPVGRLGVTFTYDPDLRAYSGYQRSFRTDALLGNSTVGQEDAVYLGARYAIGDWALEANATYSHTRFSYVITETDITDIRHWAAAEASVDLILYPGFSAELAYRLDVVRMDGQSGSGNLRDYTRHLATLGLTVSWPPPRSQQARGVGLMSSIR
jgi:hypothetical protein